MALFKAVVWALIFLTKLLIVDINELFSIMLRSNIKQSDIR